MPEEPKDIFEKFPEPEQVPMEREVAPEREAESQVELPKKKPAIKKGPPSEDLEKEIARLIEKVKETGPVPLERRSREDLQTAERLVEALVGLAKKKGAPIALEEAEGANDPYILDHLRDRLSEEGRSI